MTLTGGRSSSHYSDRLEGRRCYLRVARRSDYDFLYELETSGDLAHRWRHRGTTPAPEQVLRTLWDGASMIMIVCSREYASPYGLTVLYDVSYPGRTAYFASAATVEGKRTAVMPEGCALFIAHSFSTWDLRKIYVDVPEYNVEEFGSGLGKLFVEEGCLRRHDYWADRHWDRYTYALYRETWESTIDTTAFEPIGR